MDSPRSIGSDDYDVIFGFMDEMEGGESPSDIEDRFVEPEIRSGEARLDAHREYLMGILQEISEEARRLGIEMLDSAAAVDIAHTAQVTIGALKDEREDLKRVQQRNRSYLDMTKVEEEKASKMEVGLLEKMDRLKAKLDQRTSDPKWCSGGLKAMRAWGSQAVGVTPGRFDD